MPFLRITLVKWEFALSDKVARYDIIAAPRGGIMTKDAASESSSAKRSARCSHTQLLTHRHWLSFSGQALTHSIFCHNRAARLPRQFPIVFCVNDNIR